jgi:uroporphyrinogen-III synthase
MRRVIVLRPEPGASETAARARKHGLEPIVRPLFEVEAVAWQPPNRQAFDALLLTSANAVRFGGKGLDPLRGLPVHAVGPATAEAAREAGFEVARVGAAGVDELLGSLPAQTRLLHLCGEDRTTPGDRGRRIVEVVVYRSKERAPPDLSRLRGSVALVHSPRAGRRLAELVAEPERGSIAVAAISRAAAAAAGRGWSAVEAAERPDDDALLALAARLCQKHPGI